MPALRNARHERFCQEVAKGASDAEAYRRAGFSALRANRNATRVRALEGVTRRIAELQGSVLQRHHITVDLLLGQLEEIRVLALKGQRKQLGVARDTIIAMAKLCGLWIEKSDTVTRNIPPDKMTDEEIAQRLAELRAMNGDERPAPAATSELERERENEARRVANGWGPSPEKPKPH